MKSKTQTVTDKTNKRGGPDNAASRSRKLKTPLEIINYAIESECHNGIYNEALSVAAKYLYEAGVKPASLLDAETGEVTKVGRAIIAAVVKCAWEEELNFASDPFISDPTLDTLGYILSHRDLLDFLLAQAVEEDGQARVYGTIAKTTVDLTTTTDNGE
jgi:hypothetical protein